MVENFFLYNITFLEILYSRLGVKKNENEKQRLSDNLRKQEEAFEIVKKILADCLNKKNQS